MGSKWALQRQAGKSRGDLTSSGLPFAELEVPKPPL